MNIAVIFMLKSNIYIKNFSIRQGFKETEKLNCAKQYFR